MRSVFLIAMAPAIDLDQKTRRHAGEVSNVWTDRYLPAEMRALDFEFAQVPPKALFCVGCCMAKTACS
jgi:hypothetical protein